MRTPRGIIFDFDGVLVDTEWAIYQSWVWLYAQEGQDISIETYSPCLGAGYSHWDPAAHLEKLTGRHYDWDRLTPIRQARINNDLTRTGLMPGARELMDWCDAQGIGMTVASSSSRHWVAGWLERLGIYDRFRGVFCRTAATPSSRIRLCSSPHTSASGCPKMIALLWRIRPTACFPLPVRAFPPWPSPTA